MLEAVYVDILEKRLVEVVPREVLAPLFGGVGFSLRISRRSMGRGIEAAESLSSRGRLDTILTRLHGPCTL